VSVLAIVLGALGLFVGAGVGVVAGLLLARRTPPPQPPARHADGGRRAVQLPTLASLVIAELQVGVLAVDAEQRVVLVNPAARAMDVVDVDSLAFPPLADLARRAFESGEQVSESVDLPMSRLGREPIAVAATAVPLRTHDSVEEITAVALLLRDVSEQRRLDAVRRDFVANVSHELKTPVGALTLLGEAVQDAANDPEAVTRFGARMQKESTRLGRLVSELIELSRVQGIDPLPGSTAVPVCGLVEDALDRVRLAAEQASVRIEQDCDPALAVRGDAAQLVTAIANLVDNAIIYGGSGSRVQVSARASSDHQARPTVDVTVSDEGPGVADEEQDRIFERFYRVDPARSRATGGTGLGLAIVKNIVTNHRGSVTVRSADGRGAAFTIRLPRVHDE
jgi:two-component system sensor histidine kinase SenX3